MPFYLVSLRQSWDIPGINRRKWSNAFYLQAPSAVAAAAAGVAGWVNYLREASSDRCFAYEVYATDDFASTSDYAVQGIPAAQQRGVRPYQVSFEPYDPTVCASVTVPVVGSRPSRKFWRPGLNEGDVSGGQSLAPAIVTAIKNAFENLITEAGGVWKDVDSQEWLAPVTVRYSRRKLGRESGENLPEPPPFG